VIVQRIIHVLLVVAGIDRAADVAGAQEVATDPLSRIEVLDATSGWTRPEDEMVDALGADNWPGWKAARWSAVGVDAPGSRSAMLLQDGQRVVGAFVNQPGPIRWRSGLLGTMDLDLERVRCVGPLDHPVQSGGAQDRVLLVNGDHLGGFVEEISMDRGVRLHDGSKRDSGSWHTLGAVKAVELAARPEAGVPRSSWTVWLDDGSRVTVDTWQVDQDRLVLDGLRLPGAAASHQVDRTHVVALSSPDSALRPLADLRADAAMGPESGRLAPARLIVSPGPWPLDLRPLRLCGPGRFAWDLPAGRWMLRATLSVPQDVQSMAGCQVRVLDANEERAVFKIGKDFHPQAIHIACGSGSLVVEILTSDRSPVGGQVELRDALIHPIPDGSVEANGSRTSVPSAPAGPDDVDPR
jgi:hypothetical protein